MSRTQHYISVLLERLPKWELRSYEHQTSLDRLRDRISSAPDLREELQRLYKVKGFSDFSLCLLWIADKVERDPSLEESTLDEETLVFSLFRKAMGIVPAQPQEAPAEEPPQETFASGGYEPAPPEPAVEAPAPEEPSPRFAETASPAGESAAGDEHETRLARLLEQFLESVQSGNEDRRSLMADVLEESNRILAANSPREELNLFCRQLLEFIEYISSNQYLDDIRVMNILSNIQDPFTQWTRTDPSARAGVLDQANEILANFKTMFE